MNRSSTPRRAAAWRTLLGVGAALGAASCGGGSDEVAVPPPPPAASPAPAPAPAVAANCPALASGTFRVIEARPDAGGIDAQTGTVTIDAAALTVTDAGGTSPLTPAGTCRYTADGGEATFAVSAGGFVVGRSRSGASFRTTLAFPEQTVPLADLAGPWNGLAFERTGDASGTYLAEALGVTLDANGAYTTFLHCPGVTACTPVPGPLPALSVRASGGFDLRPADLAYTDRAFAYRAGTSIVLVTLAGNGSFGIWTRAQALPLPAVGNVNANVSFAVDANLVATVPTLNQHQVETVDTAGGRYVRVSHTPGDTDHHRETLILNSPRVGFTTRPGAPQEPVLDGTPPTVPVQPFVSLGIGGMGMTVLHLPGPGRFMFSLLTPPQP